MKPASSKRFGIQKIIIEILLAMFGEINSSIWGIDILNQLRRESIVSLINAFVNGLEIKKSAPFFNAFCFSE